MTVNRHLTFSAAEMRRLRETCRALNTSYVEFVHFAVLQALDECDAIARESAGVLWNQEVRNGPGRASGRGA